MNYASLSEVFPLWGTQKRKEFNTPSRTAQALEKHKSLLSSHAASSESMAGTISHARNQIEPFSVNYSTPQIPPTQDWAYASTPPEYHQSLHFDAKIDRLMRMMEGTGGETPSTHDLLLYVFTGVFALFLLDSFVTMGRHSRR